MNLCKLSVMTALVVLTDIFHFTTGKRGRRVTYNCDVMPLSCK